MLYKIKKIVDTGPTFLNKLQKENYMKSLLLSIAIFLFSQQIFADDLIIISADWCANCIKLKYFLSENSEKYSDFYKIKFVDYDKDNNYKQKYKIKSIPASLIIKDSKLKSMKIGYGDDYGTWLDAHKE